MAIGCYNAIALGTDILTRTTLSEDHSKQMVSVKIPLGVTPLRYGESNSKLAAKKYPSHDWHKCRQSRVG